MALRTTYVSAPDCVKRCNSQSGTFAMQADVQVEQNRKHFYELSLEYVCRLQEIQERKKFEFVEPVSSAW